MARAPRAVVQVDRLSDQVYQLIREDLISGGFTPGQRLPEVELAERYRVSRTPVREALFQLAREGLLTGNERGYSTPVYSREEIIHRLEVKRLLEPSVAEHVATDATEEQIKSLLKLHAQEKAAHAGGRVKVFIRVNQELRQAYLSVCKNDLLARCVRQVDDQFESIRSRIHGDAVNRTRSLDHEARLLKAVGARDKRAAAAEVGAFIDYLDVFYRETEPDKLA